MKKFAYGYRSQVALKDLPRQQYLPNTLTNNCCAQIHHFILQGSSIAADDGSRKTSITLELQPGRNNEVNDVTVRGLPMDAGGR